MFNQLLMRPSDANDHYNMTKETMLFDNQSFEQDAHLILPRTLAYDFVSKNIAPSAHFNDAAVLSSKKSIIQIIMLPEGLVRA